jgi:hypothetical protein
LIKNANDRRAPLLVAYPADGWSGKISYYRRHTGAANHLLVTREKTEFSLQRLLVKMRQNDKEVVAMQFAEPRPLLHGVSAAEFFVAYNDFAPCVRRLHQHLVLQWFTFDGGLFSRMMRLCRGKQQLLYQDEELFRALLPGPRSEMDDDAAERCRRLEGRDFCFGMQCLSHVFSNANKWGLSHVSSPESLDDLHIAIAAARQSSTTLLRSLPQFVLSRVTFEEPDWDTTTWLQRQALWNFLLDDARMVHDIMELNPRWDRQRDRLLVSTSFRDGLVMPAYERMESILAYCCRWEDFTLTRWSSVSRACRLWVASLLVGLDGQMETCREDPAIGNYFIHGHDRGKRLEVRRLALTACFASGVSDIPGQMLIEDERFMMQAESIWNAMLSEADYISSLPASIWQWGATLLLEEDCIAEGHDIQQEALWAAETSMAYAWRLAFRQLEEYPLCLTQGGVQANLAQVLASGPDEDLQQCSFTAQLRRAYETGT